MQNENELTAALATIEKCREIVDCPAGVDLQDHLRQLAAESVALKEACGGNGSYRNCPACTFSEYIEAPETHATDRIYAGIKADGAEACVRALVTSDDDDFSDAPNICAEVARSLREGVK